MLLLLVCVPFAGRAQVIDVEAETFIDQTASGTTVTDSVDLVVRDDSVKVVRKPFLDAVISGSNQDSVHYDPRTKMFYFYEKGDVKYRDKNIKADYMQVDMKTKVIIARGREDTVTGRPTRPEFKDGASSYTMDTLRYDLEKEIANASGMATQDGEGYLRGDKIKKLKDNTINIQGGMLTTCDLHDPHFYIRMTKAKTIPDKKVIFGPSYIVMEDVPIPVLAIPFGFFPLMGESNSGFIVPTFGEEMNKGFFIRDGGYYLKFNDYVDLSLTGGIYTFGSWEASTISRYVKRYKFSGDLSLRFSKDIFGERGSSDYINQNNYKISWSHRQDPKWNPSSQFSARVDFSSSGYTKYGSTTMNDYLNTQTNSSIAYSKSWVGKPFSLSTNLQHSQNTMDTTVSLSFPNLVFSVSRIYPFKRRNAEGRARWYEKISLSYTGTLQNNVTVKERDLFTDKMFEKMRYGVNHVIPIQTSLNLFQYVNISPSATYQERWYFKKHLKKWDPQLNQVVNGDTLSGFYRVYDYRFSVNASTNIYGIHLAKKSSKSPLRGIRHVITPSVGFSYTPDFGSKKYGYYDQVQSDTLGNTMVYSPFQNGLYGVPSSGPSAAMSFSLMQNLAIKVRNRNDTVDRKVTIIDNLNIGSSYNFLADSLNLAPFQISLRATLTKELAINVSAVLDPYQLDATGRRINKFMVSQGKLGRITSVSTSFGYSFNSSKKGAATGAINDINSSMVIPTTIDNHEQDYLNRLDANTRRQVMTSQYYDFNIPWNLGLNYTFSYSKPGLKSSIMQSIGFQGSVTITEKWGLSFNGGYDLQEKKVTPGTFSLSRDLHCWQMHFSWVPIGFRKSWSFTIAVKASMLKDLKLDKNSSYFDNFYD